MNTYTATVIKTGNSIALRVPKQYAQDAKLVPGEKVLLNLPSKQKQQDYNKIKRLISALQKVPAFHTISDPVTWQREIRQDRALPNRK
jgi:antitoxin component of MazEF toxin-antitoxin module